ncbi:MAG: hypothetical protein K0V04_39300 [Deltaproteobacteria bacterium]|nr:hypothetical protein [Deltaproteobacteria bacterium]
MTETGAGPAAGTVGLGCRYCGATDSLPIEVGARVHALRQRLRSLWWAKDQLHQQDIMFCEQLERTWLPGTLRALIGPLSICTVLALGMAYAANDWRSALWGGGLAAAFVAVAAGMIGGFLLAKRRYQRTVRPWITALVPSSPGARSRCHCCGGKLPPVQDAFIECHYCGATNLVTPELAQRRAQDLERETAAYRSRAQGAAVLIREHVGHVRRAIQLGHLAGFGLVGLVGLASFGMTWLLR